MIVLTSKIGRFEFDEPTTLSLAKLVRDSVVGQWLNPKPGHQILKTSLDVQAFIRACTSQVLSAVLFDLVFPDEKHVPEPALEELPQPPLIPVPPIWIHQTLAVGERPSWMDQ